MKQNRRSMIKGMGLGAGAAVLAASGQAQAQQAAPGTPTNQRPIKGIDITNIVTANGLGLGVKTARGVLDVAAVERDRKIGLPTKAIDVISGRGNFQALGLLLANGAAGAPSNRLIPEGQVRFGNIIENPGKILCVGLNYAAHAAEGGNKPPPEPIMFSKFNSAVNHHNGTIAVSKSTAPPKWDYEAELVLVMGKGGRDIPEASALDYVYGYASGNDFTNRDLQRRSSQWLLGKSTDGSGPFGPWLVSADQVDVNNLSMKMIVNGEVRQDTNTRLMIFNCAKIVAYCSNAFALDVGDVIFTGTCEGVISGYPPDKQIWLKPGDKMVTSIEKIGDLHVTLT